MTPFDNARNKSRLNDGKNTRKHVAKENYIYVEFAFIFSSETILSHMVSKFFLHLQPRNA